ncbi:small, acid-soluble spore protein L [Virgibacillus sp. W0430]
MDDSKHVWSNKQVNNSVNPQGEAESERSKQPRSKLEQKAKKKNTKI